MTQIPLFQPKAEWSPPKLIDLPSWADAKRVGIDIETCDPEIRKLGPGVRRDGFIAGVSFAIEDGPSFYLPLRHQNGDNMENPHAALLYLKDQAKKYTGLICGANLQYDLDYLAEAGVKFPKVERFRDCQIAEPLIDELHQSYSLQAIATRRGVFGKDEVGLDEAAVAWGLNAKKEMWKLPARHVAHYAKQDAILPLRLLRMQERDIDDQGLWEIYNLESDVLPILVEMRRRGVAIDTAQLQKVEDWSLQQETECLEKIRLETGIDIGVGNVWKSERLAPVLTAIGADVPVTPKTKKPSIKKDDLDHIDHPVAKMMNRARKVNKLRTTFAKSIREHMVSGRIHCSFNQLRKTDDDSGESNGARYGRLSSCDPNLQQQPSRDDFAKMWRAIYVPDGDGLWACCDYSQQEPRMLVHFAERLNLWGASDAGNRYRNDPNADNHTMMARMIYGYGDDEEPSKVHRTNAKIIFLGLCYSMGGAKLARGLGLPTEWIQTRGGKWIEVAGKEAQSILDQFNNQVPFVKATAEVCENLAKKRGWIKTLAGRRCRFPLKENGKEYDWAHKALNRLIQGSSADQTKMAMVAAHRAGFKLQLQVHDEIDLTVESPEEGEALGEVMRNCVELKVPSKVDVEIGPNWGYIG